MARPRRSDVIAAIATAPGRGGIGVVRVSGPQLGGMATSFIGRQPPPRVATLANIRSRDGSTIDKGIVVFFPGPHSFTGEDVLELQGHGGPVLLRMLLGRCIELGARLAEPGEFTQRAFLNGKLDLAQAEAVADLIDASSEQAVRSALRSLSGAFSVAVRELQERLTDLRMRVEAGLDFPEDEIDTLQSADLLGRLAAIRGTLDEVLAKARQGSLLRGGLQVVIAGRPNVGKSSLLNRLAGEERAIVTPIAGTTRDALRESILVEGVPLHVVDTAGLRDTTDQIEEIGIERSWREIDRADIVLHVVDARDGWRSDDDAIEQRLPRSVEHVVVANKIDLAQVDCFRELRDGRVWIGLSAHTGAGVGLLQEELLRAGGWRPGIEDSYLARERHLQALQATALFLGCAASVVGQDELFAEELRLAQSALSEITGQFSADDLLGEIFSGFCIGK